MVCGVEKPLPSVQYFVGEIEKPHSTLGKGKPLRNGAVQVLV